MRLKCKEYLKNVFRRHASLSRTNAEGHSLTFVTPDQERREEGEVVFNLRNLEGHLVLGLPPRVGLLQVTRDTEVLAHLRCIPQTFLKNHACMLLNHFVIVAYKHLNNGICAT